MDGRLTPLSLLHATNDDASFDDHSSSQPSRKGTSLIPLSLFAVPPFFHLLAVSPPNRADRHPDPIAALPGFRNRTRLVPLS